MSQQQQTGVSTKAVEGARPIRRRTFRVMESAALVNACSNFVAQLDSHQFGAAIVLGIIALATLSVVVVALAVTLRAALASRECVATSSRRGRRVDDGRQVSSKTCRKPQ